jgi:excinuclease ABC subunit C
VNAPVDRAYGPVLIGRRMRRAFDRLNAVFQLRDCSERVPMLFADQKRLFDTLPSPQCLRHELGACLGPCAGLCSSGEYSQAVRAAMALVEGLDNAMLEQLETSMREAAAGQRFERAALLRDACDDLRYVQQQVAHITDVRRQWTFIYAPPARGTRPTWILIRGGVPIGALRVPRDATQAAHCQGQLVDRFPIEPRSADLDERDSLPFVLLTSRWFRMHPEEFQHVVTIDQALQSCQALLA